MFLVQCKSNIPRVNIKSVCAPLSCDIPQWFFTELKHSFVPFLIRQQKSLCRKIVSRRASCLREFLVDSDLLRRGWKDVVGTKLAKVNVNLVFVWIQYVANVTEVGTIVGIRRPALQHQRVERLRAVFGPLEPLAGFQVVQQLVVANGRIRKSTCESNS